MGILAYVLTKWTWLKRMKLFQTKVSMEVTSTRKTRRTLKKENNKEGMSAYTQNTPQESLLRVDSDVIRLKVDCGVLHSKFSKDIQCHDDDEEIRQWHYRLLAEKMHPGYKAAQDALVAKITNPIRTVLEITPVKWITFDMAKVQAFEAGTDGGAYKEHLLSADTQRLQAEVARRIRALMGLS